MRARGTQLLVMVALLGACSLPGSGAVPWSQEEGEKVASWTQAEDADRPWIDEAMPIDQVVLASEGDRAAWLEEVPGGVEDDDSFDALRGVDLSENFIVIGGYGRCTEESAVTVSGDDVTFEVRTEDEETNCGWMPYTIDAWSVPLEATGGTAPEEVGQED